MGLSAVDKIAERHGLDGVYGPLYRLFEVADQKFNIAVKLTAGNRCLPHILPSNLPKSAFKASSTSSSIMTPPPPKFSIS